MFKCAWNWSLFCYIKFDKLLNWHGKVSVKMVRAPLRLHSTTVLPNRASRSVPKADQKVFWGFNLKRWTLAGKHQIQIDVCLGVKGTSPMISLCLYVQTSVTTPQYQASFYSLRRLAFMMHFCADIWNKSPSDRYWHTVIINTIWSIQTIDRANGISRCRQPVLQINTDLQFIINLYVAVWL